MGSIPKKNTDPNPIPEISLVIPDHLLASVPPSVRDELMGMPAEQQDRFVKEYNDQSKSLVMAYLCSLIYCHYVLLGRWAMSGWMWASLFIASTLGFLWWLIDLVRIPGMVREYNERLAADLMRKTRLAPAGPASAPRA